MLKKLIVLAGIAGTLGVAAPAFADWHGRGPVVRGPIVRPIARPGVVVRPGFGVGVYAPGYYNSGYYNQGYYDPGYYAPSYGYNYGYAPPAYRYRRWEWRHHPRYYRRGW